MGEWQPIETAPRDGTDILAIVAGDHPESGRPYVPDVIRWTYDEWWSANWGDDERYVYHPTHWMPLPPPPFA